MTTTVSDLENAYQFCQQLAQSHYENFPVASILLPKRLRQPISVIYAFARTADDFADEGSEDHQTRLRLLDDYSTTLKQLGQQHYQGNNPIFIALADVIQKHKLPIQLFDDLLSAFKQDVVKDKYATFGEVLDYCKRSANPVGRLLLYLDGNPSNKQLQQSDAICTALQLINFYQDIIQDLTEQDRTYLPKNELEQFGVCEQDLLQTNTDKIAPLIRFQYQRTQSIMEAGISLGTTVKGRLGWEIRAMTLGGITTLNKLMSQRDNALLNRPRLSKLTMLKILLLSASRTIYLQSAKQLFNVNKRP
jgi:hydroxysqualene synthase